MSLKIIGVGKGIPKKGISNNELADFLDTSDTWISSRTGIKNRYVCTNETLTDLSAIAAVQAVENADLSLSDIDTIICSTIGGDYHTPSLACCIAERIGINCPAFDINAACSGFIYGLEIASGFLSSRKAKNILIICAEILSTQMDWGDRSTCVLFGDGAAACVITEGDALKYISLSVSANSSMINIPAGTGNSPFIHDKADGGFLRMQGQEVFKFAVSTLETEIKQALAALKIPLDEIDYFVLHQGNKRIIDSTRTKLGQPQDKFPINIDRYGNLSSASIPLLLFEMLEDGRLKTGNTVFMSAFGAGMTTGSCVFVWE